MGIDMAMRLDKYLAQAGIGTRSEVKKIIRLERAFINGTVAKKPEQKVLPEDIVEIDGEIIQYEKYEYYMLNKPSGVVSATKDAKDTTVVELITDEKVGDIFPVGRLDKDTEGLMLLTNDGELAHNLLSPRKHVAKTYFVRVEGSIDEKDITLFEHGLDIGDDKLTKPACITQVRHIKGGENQTESELLITITEGRYHQIKRMFAKVKKPVCYLKRISMGSLVLDESLAYGEYRALSSEELEKLKKN